VKRSARGLPIAQNRAIDSAFLGVPQSSAGCRNRLSASVDRRRNRQNRGNSDATSHHAVAGDVQPRGCCSAASSVPRKRAACTAADVRLPARGRVRARGARSPSNPRLARRAAGRVSLTEEGALIDFTSAESHDISRCSALLRPPAEVVGTSLRSVPGWVSGARRMQMKSPRTRAAGEPASLPRAHSASRAQNTQLGCNREVQRSEVSELVPLGLARALRVCGVETL
jgi:hypothetical protein